MKESDISIPEQTDAIFSPLKQHVGSVIEIWRKRDVTIRIPVDGNSMAPLIRSGDYVSVRTAVLHALHPGDIVAFLQGGGLIVHRLVKKKAAGGRRWFCQKGDTLRGWGWIEEENLFGRVDSIEKNGRRLNIADGRLYLMNRLIGYLVWCWVTWYEAASKAWGHVRVGRSQTVLAGMIKSTPPPCPPPSRGRVLPPAHRGLRPGREGMKHVLSYAMNRIIQRLVLTFMGGRHWIDE
jgi:signal peptidase I